MLEWPNATKENLNLKCGAIWFGDQDKGMNEMLILFRLRREFSLSEYLVVFFYISLAITLIAYSIANFRNVHVQNTSHSFILNQ